MPEAKSDSAESLESMVKKSIELSETIHGQNRKILRRMTMMTVASYLRLLLFVVPIILAAIYLPPLIEEYMIFFKEAIGSGEGAAEFNEILSQFSGEDVQSILKQIRQ